ncbi:MAG: hypothetical protein RLZZ64_1497, partial [Bacteroidota bacterium]
NIFGPAIVSNEAKLFMYFIKSGVNTFGLLQPGITGPLGSENTKKLSKQFKQFSMLGLGTKLYWPKRVVEKEMMNRNRIIILI